MADKTMNDDTPNDVSESSDSPTPAAHSKRSAGLLRSPVVDAVLIVAAVVLAVIAFVQTDPTSAVDGPFAIETGTSAISTDLEVRVTADNQIHFDGQQFSVAGKLHHHLQENGPLAKTAAVRSESGALASTTLRVVEVLGRHGVESIQIVNGR